MENINNTTSSDIPKSSTSNNISDSHIKENTASQNANDQDTKYKLEDLNNQNLLSNSSKDLNSTNVESNTHELSSDSFDQYTTPSDTLTGDNIHTIEGKLDVSLSEVSEDNETVSDLTVSDIGQYYSDPGDSSLLSTSQQNTTRENSHNLSSGDLCSNSDDEEDEESEVLENLYPVVMRRNHCREQNPTLPDTVTVLNLGKSSKVYVVGTAHFSLESQEDVSKTIQAVQPDIVMVELCKSRINILSLDEQTILEESKNMGVAKIRSAIKQNGFIQGAMYLLLLSMSAHLTKQLGMAPGGEFRRAFLEARKVPGCVVHLGDRPIYITLQRALATLSFWKKLQIGLYMLTNKECISKEQVEQCKQRDLLEKMLAEMTGEFPELSKVFVEERDTYLAYSLQTAATSVLSQSSVNDSPSTVVVGVVGIGHVPGIVKKWSTITEADIVPILRIPKPSKTSKVIHATMKYTTYGLIIYGCYRMISGSRVERFVKPIISWFHH